MLCFLGHPNVHVTVNIVMYKVSKELSRYCTVPYKYSTLSLQCAKGIKEKNGMFLHVLASNALIK